MSVRRQAIIRLLETRNDNLPEPTRTPDTAPGFVHRKKVPVACLDCLANDRVMVTCETCRGRGYVEEFRERDPYAESKTAKYGLDGARHDATHARDRTIEALARQTRPAPKEADLLEEANREPYGWERARAQMVSRFDYAALDRVLDELRGHDPVAYRALHAVYVYGWLVEVGVAAEVACDRGLAFLSPRLAAFELARGRALRTPGVKQPATNMFARGRGSDPRALEQRDAAVRAAIAAGAATAEVAANFDLSISQVNRIVRSAAA